MRLDTTAPELRDGWDKPKSNLSFTHCRRDSRKQCWEAKQSRSAVRQDRGKGNSGGMLCVADAKHKPSPLAGRCHGGWGYGEHRLL